MSTPPQIESIKSTMLNEFKDQMSQMERLALWIAIHNCNCIVCRSLSTVIANNKITREEFTC